MLKNIFNESFIVWCEISLYKEKKVRSMITMYSNK